MAGVLIERNGCLRDILHLLKAETWECSWLLTELACYDYCGWGGMTEYTRRNLCFGLWHDLYHHHPERAVRWDEVAARYDDYWSGEEKNNG